MMLPSNAHKYFTDWGINPIYSWQTLELDDIELDGISTPEDLRVILVENSIRLIEMAVDDDAPRWSPYFTWACAVLDQIPMTQTEQTLALGTAARFKAKRLSPHYLSLTRKLLKGKKSHAPKNARPSRPSPSFPLAS
jgi:hypothetical protein